MELEVKNVFPGTVWCNLFMVAIANWEGGEKEK